MRTLNNITDDKLIKEINTYANLIMVVNGFNSTYGAVLHQMLLNMHCSRWTNKIQRNIVLLDSAAKADIAEKVGVGSDYVARITCAFVKHNILIRLSPGVYQVNAELVGCKSWDKLKRIEVNINLRNQVIKPTLIYKE